MAVTVPVMVLLCVALADCDTVGEKVLAVLGLGEEAAERVAPPWGLALLL